MLTGLMCGVGYGLRLLLLAGLALAPVHRANSEASYATPLGFVALPLSRIGPKI